MAVFVNSLCLLHTYADTTQICRTLLKDLPFDIRNWNTIKYDAGSTFALRDHLASRLKTALEI